MPIKHIPLHPTNATKEEPKVPQGAAALTYPKTAALVRLLGGLASGVVGQIPSPPTTSAAAAIGGLAERGAEYIENPQGTPPNTAPR